MKEVLSDDHDLPQANGALAVVMPRRLSQIFRELAARPQDAITLGEIRNALGDRSFATLLILFSALNLLPFPPGATLVLGVPIILVAAQMLLGYQSAWLPRKLLARSIEQERFQGAVDRLVPRLEQLEGLVRPRYWPFSRDRADRIIGAVALVLAIVVFLPIPLGNWLPAFAIVVIGLAHSERDGLLLAFGIALGLLSLALIGAVVGTAGVLAGAVFGIDF